MITFNSVGSTTSRRNTMEVSILNGNLHITSKNTTHRITVELDAESALHLASQIQDKVTTNKQVNFAGEL